MVKYKQKLKAAVDFIEANLDSSLDIKSVAKEVGYSPYHFHRIFSASLGESVAEYIRRRRLARAFKMLVETDTPIYQIALEAMFDSQESFTRAFKKMYGFTPGKMRSEKMSTTIRTDKTFSYDLLEHLNEGITMEPTYKERKHELAIGMGGSFGDDAFEEIALLWNRFNERVGEIENTISGYSFGVCLESHPQFNMRDADNFVYFAAMPVSSVEKIPQGMHVVEIPESKYAVFTHSGPINKITHTVKYIWGTWVPKNSEILKKGPDFELYDERFDVEKLEGEVDIYLPVR